MPKNTACPGVPRVTDPITDQEIAFAHLILSGTMNDRCAAETAGLNPDTADYTKAKPRVRAYMAEHRAAVTERLVDEEADLSRDAVEGLRQLNLGRDQILTRLWELATLSHEATRGTIAGQIKALSMIVAIEGLIPSRTMNDRRLSSSAGTQPVPHVAHPEPTLGPAPKLANATSSPSLDRNQPSPLNPFINPESLNRPPAATDYVFDAVLNNASSHRLSFSPETGFPAQRR
jgi:hypothetical protein